MPPNLYEKAPVSYAKMMKRRWKRISTCRRYFVVTTGTTLILLFGAIHRMSQDKAPVTLGDVDCHLDAFSSYYATQFASSTRGVPFDSACLSALIDAHPDDIALRVAHVRRRYMERMQQSSRYLVYYCPGQGCGGIGNRITGIASAVLMALGTNSKFAIFTEQPVPWDTYLRPIGSDMDFKSEILEFIGYENVGSGDNGRFALRDRLIQASNDTETGLLWNNMNNKMQLENFPRQYNFPQVFFPTDKRKLVLCHNNAMYYDFNDLTANPFLKDTLEEYRLTDLTPSELQHVAIQLFASQPSELLANAAQPYLDQMKDDYVIGIQIRLGNTNNEIDIPFYDLMRHPFSSVQCMTSKAQELCATYSNGKNCTIFGTSDSKRAVQKIRHDLGPNFQVVITSGNNPHTDRGFAKCGRNQVLCANQSLEHLKPFLDWYILGSRSDALVITVASLGTTAAFFRSNGNSVRYRPTYQVSRQSNDNNYKMEEEGEPLATPADECTFRRIPQNPSEM